jgi:hypothetical protein
MNIDVNIFNKILASQIQHTLKGSYTRTKDLYLGCKGSSIYKISIQYINRIKAENPVIISIDAEKAFDKIQQHFM